MYDVCVIGHVTKDIIEIDGSTTELAGGTVYYAGMALRSLGLTVAVITKVAAGDAPALLDPMARRGIHLFVGHSRFTTTFENSYASPDWNRRIQKVKAVADPFIPDDIRKISAAAFHLGPLTSFEMSPEFIEEVARFGGLTSLDVQGLTRGIKGELVVPQDWEEKHRGLVHVDILKAVDSEAMLLSGERDIQQAAERLSDLGPAEVIITMGSSGSLIYSDRSFSRIPAVPAATVADPTGCGDTFAAGYIAHRLRSKNIRQAGEFAARLASVKLEASGALTSARLPEQLRSYWQGLQRG